MASILEKLHHNNVLRIFELVMPVSLASYDEICILLESPDSDMKKLCKQDVTLSPSHIRTLMGGLKFTHSAGIYHRDLKPANCFANQDCTVKIGDLEALYTLSYLSTTHLARGGGGRWCVVW